jgi:hypothetical protein
MGTLTSKENKNLKVNKDIVLNIAYRNRHKVKGRSAETATRKSGQVERKENGAEYSLKWRTI